MLEVLTGSSIEEGLRFAYAASRLMPASIVVGGAAVLAGLLGAAAMRKVRPARPPVASRAASVPWVLGVALLASWIVASSASAAVLCRKGHSARLVLRAQVCRPQEHAVQPSELGIERSPTCMETVDLAWREVDALRVRLEGARDLAARLERQPWDGAWTWLAMQALEIAFSLDRLEQLAAELGVLNAAGPIGLVRQLVVDGWGRPAETCAAALELLPALEAALPVPPAA
jgi:hypothetical protein